MLCLLTFCQAESYAQLLLNEEDDEILLCSFQK